ncbi:MAG: InlB B-repeat-containing protein [Clostridia bacterium]|nr:InlB B-repeat-containing protein [Clostridia bacterium]
MATVDSSGYVRGVSAGTTTLSANVYDNAAGKSYSRTATITVTGGSNPTPTPTPGPSTTYERVYSIENGGQYILVADGSVSGSTGYAVGNTIVSSNHYLTPVAITVSSSYASVSSGVNAITWTASGNSTSGWTFRNVGNSKYLGLDSAQYLYPSNTAVAWKYTSSYGLDNQIDSEGYYYLSYSTGRYTTSKNSAAIRLYKVSSGTPAPTTYTVTFKDWDGTVLKTQQVAYGGAATPPANPTRPGYTFTGWDRSYSYITADTVITAQYTQNSTGNTYQRVTTIYPGDYYIIVAANSVSGTTGYAVGNTVVSNNRYLNPVQVTVNSNGTLTVPSGVNLNAITWYAGGSSTYGYTFRNVANSKYMGLDSAQYLYPSTSGVAWKYTNGALDNQIDTDGYYYLSYSTGRYTTSKTAGTVYIYKVG